MDFVPPPRRRGRRTACCCRGSRVATHLGWRCCWCAGALGICAPGWWRGSRLCCAGRRRCCIRWLDCCRRVGWCCCSGRWRAGAAVAPSRFGFRESAPGSHRIRGCVCSCLPSARAGPGSQWWGRGWSRRCRVHGAHSAARTVAVAVCRGRWRDAAGVAGGRWGRSWCCGDAGGVWCSMDVQIRCGAERPGRCAGCCTAACRHLVAWDGGCHGGGNRPSGVIRRGGLGRRGRNRGGGRRGRAGNSGRKRGRPVEGGARVMAAATAAALCTRRAAALARSGATGGRIQHGTRGDGGESRGARAARRQRVHGEGACGRCD
mmetsp:Transcript_20074/g.64033  ORF Transcript_20074/g.64033 Transcript_20074/m.64033 type:complete len:318 (+) Transcript_20074:172-1125(+)